MARSGFPKLGSLALLACSIFVSAGCFSISPPPALIEDPDLENDLTLRKIDLNLSLAPATSRLGPTAADSDAPGPKVELRQAEEGEPLAYRPGFSPQDLDSLTGRLKDALDLAFINKPEVVGAQPEEEGLDRITSVFSEAERRGSQIVMTAELLDNSLQYRGFSTVGWFFDFSLLTGAPPFHWWIPDETFEIQRSLKVAFYDVRDTSKPLYVTDITAVVERNLNEFQHEIVLFNPIRGLWDSGEGRYGETNLRAVYEGLGAHADRELQIELLKVVTNGLRPLLSSTAIQERLKRGDPEQARLYAIMLGQDRGRAQRASADARVLAQVLQRRFGLLPANTRLLDQSIGREELLEAVKSLRTKAVDRVLFFYAGQGGQDGAGQFMVLGNGDQVRFEDLAANFKSLSAENFVFLLDSSFGDSARANIPGSRTMPGSQRGAGRYLSSLADVDRGWQVICAAGADEVTGEFRDQGLLTGLVLEGLEEAGGQAELGALVAQTSERFSRRARALLGGSHQLFRAPRDESRRAFILSAAKTQGSSAN